MSVGMFKIIAEPGSRAQYCGKRNAAQALSLTGILFFCLLLVSCAKMGQPDGGWYDETPPRIIGATPQDKDVNVTSRKVSIYFNEYIKVDNATEKVVVSPPQLEMPEIKGAGKSIKVELKDSLKANTTYTIDFSDAITDNNEDNPLGNYTYSFSTGNEIDTMEVAGYVLEAESLEPVKGILVGLYSNLADSAFTKEPMLRVSRTDSRGRFVIKGVASGSYRIYALEDADGNYVFNQKSEKIAFNHDIIMPSSKPDVRQDTLWRDSLHIEAVQQVPYTHFLPDDIVLRAFTELQTDRYFVKSERLKADHFTLFFSYGSDSLPEIRGLNFDDKDALVVEPSLRRDTVTYWLRDTVLVNQDTLRMEVRYLATDTTGVLRTQTDTLEILAKTPYAKRMKEKEKKYEEWKKKQEKAEKRGDSFETEMRREPLAVAWNAPSEFAPDKNISVVMPAPLARMDTSMIHLYSKHDTLWYRSDFVFRKMRDVPRTYELLGEWRPDIEYSLEIDSAAFEDIYGNVSDAYKQGFKVGSMDSYSSLMFTFEGMSDTAVVAQLLDNSGNIVKETSTRNATAEFYYVKPAAYYLRMFVDSNGNGVWDTGNYAADIQPEAVYYYPKKIECKAKWDMNLSWNPVSVGVERQKPSEIVKQKPEKERTIKKRNLERAKKLGIQYIPKL